MSDPNTPENPPAQNPAPAQAPAAPAAPAASPAESTPPATRWTNLAIAVGIVTVGGFILGRATTATPPEPTPAAPVALNVPPAAKRLPPELIRRLRLPPRRTALGPAIGMQLANNPQAAMGATDPNGRPAMLPNEIPAVAKAMNEVQPQVQSCVAGLSTVSAHAVVVKYRVHGDPAAGGTVEDARVLYPPGNDPQLRDCVMKAVRGVKVPGLNQNAVGVHAFAGK